MANETRFCRNAGVLELPVPVEFYGKAKGGQQENKSQSQEQKGYLQIRCALKS